MKVFILLMVVTVALARNIPDETEDIEMAERNELPVLPPGSPIEESELTCIVTTPPPEDICTDGDLEDDIVEIPEVTPIPDDVCADGLLDEPLNLPYCPPGTRC